ncbi:MAG: GNAT family N-acetyltransferase [Candidatus Sulfotelmatobacter sp.]
MNDKNNSLSAVLPLAEHHICNTFDCGKHESLTGWLKRYALESQKAKSARTFIVHRENAVVGYYSLYASCIHRNEASERVAKGQPARPIPSILLARLAIDKSEQGKGLGKALLKDALSRSLNAANEIGARVILVHAIDEEAKNFYRKFGFETSPVDDLYLMLLMKDLQKFLSSAPTASRS